MPKLLKQKIFFFKIAISLQYLKRELSHEVNFLHANKHERLFETDTMIWKGIV